MPLPEEIKSVLLEERTGLTQKGEQNLRVLAGGSANARQVSVALRGTDTTSQKLTGTPAQCTFYLSDNETLPENDEESREVCLLDSEEERAMLEEVDVLDLGESEAELVLAEQQSQGMKKTWSQNTDLKRQLRTD